MAAAAMMEAYINGLTQGKIKEYMEKNKSNLEKHIKKTIPATRDDLKAPDLPIFAGANKTGFELVCSYIRDHNEYTITKISQINEDYKDEVLRDVSLMITGNAGLLVENLDNAKAIKDHFVSSIETANEHTAANVENYKKVSEDIRKIGSECEANFKNLVPADGTPGAVNHLEIVKAVEKCHMANEGKVQTFIKDQTRSINSTIKEAMGTGNRAGPRPANGPPKATPTPSAWGTPSNPTPPTIIPDTQPTVSTAPNLTSNPNPTQDPPQTGNGNAQNQEPEYITVSRCVAATDDQGVEYAAWTDTRVKKRNRDFRFTKEAEDQFKAADTEEAKIARARRQIMIYGLPDPKVGDKKTEIGNIRMVADEFSKKWLQDKGFNIQKSDLKNCDSERLWNYGGKTHKGPKPLKVTFDTPEIANKFMTAAKAAGCDSSRTKIKFGKFQDISVDSEDWPKYFLRPGSTWKERQVFLTKKKERAAHRASDEYKRYKDAKERTNKNTHRIAESDLDDMDFLDPDDPGETEFDPNKNKGPPGVGKKSLPGGVIPNTGEKDEVEIMEHDNTNASPETEAAAGTGGSGTAEESTPPRGGDNGAGGSGTAEESTPLRSGDNGAVETAVEAVENENISDENDKKRKSYMMSPENSLTKENLAKKTSVAGPSKLNS